MRAIRIGLFAGFAILLACVGITAAQVKVVKKAVDTKKEDPKKEAPKDQPTQDRETLRSVGLADDTPSILGWFKRQIVNDADKARINALIKQTGDDSFDRREAASAELVKTGVPAVALVRLAAAAKDQDYEIIRRCNLVLATLEKVPTRDIVSASARLLAPRRDEGIVETLLAYLPLVDEDGVTDEIRRTFAAQAVRDGKPDPLLTAALESRTPTIRAMAAEAFVRSKDKASVARMREYLKKEADADVKMTVALALVNDAREKEVVADVIQLLATASTEKGWRAEELLYQLAGEAAPLVSLGTDKATKEKARDEWNKWWSANAAKTELTRLDSEASFGLTVICENNQRGGLGRVVAIGGDGKERWQAKNLNFPLDAVPLPGKRILVAEHNRSRIVEREIDGKEIWQEGIPNPVNCGRLPNGVTWAVGRNGIVEWERGDGKGQRKKVFEYNRNQGDIVAGTRLKSGEYVIMSNSYQQVIQIDRKGAEVKNHSVGGNGVNYYGTVDAIGGSKVLVTLMTQVQEMDMANGKTSWVQNIQNAYSANRLRNGNTLIASQNTGKVYEVDKDGKETKWSYTSTDRTYRPFRAFRR